MHNMYLRRPHGSPYYFFLTYIQKRMAGPKIVRPTIVKTNNTSAKIFMIDLLLYARELRRWKMK